MPYMLKNQVKKSLFLHIIMLLTCLTYASRTYSEEETNAPTSQDEQVSNTDKNLENIAPKELANETSHEEVTWYFAGILGNSSFNGETSLVSSNFAGLDLGVNFYKQTIQAYFQGMAQSYNSGISDYASSQSSFSYSNEFSHSLRFEGGISRVESNSSINSTTSVSYGGLTYLNPKNWKLGARYYSSRYMLSVAKDIQTTQFSPFIEWHPDPVFLNTQLKLGLRANSSKVNTTYNNEVFFTSEGLKYLSYIYELGLRSKSSTLTFRYWNGEEYATISDSGRFIRSLFNQYIKGTSIEFSYSASSNLKLIFSLANEQFFERESNHLAMEQIAKLASSLTF